MMWIRNRVEVVYGRRFQVVIRGMRPGELRAIAVSLHCVELEALYDQLVFTELRARSYWDYDRFQESGLRNQSRSMVCLKSFEIHEVAPNVRREKYVVHIAQFATSEPPLVLSMSTPPVDAYRSRDTLLRSEQDIDIVRSIGLSEHLMGSVMAFVDFCQNGCLFSGVDDFPCVYDAGVGCGGALQSYRENLLVSRSLM